MSAAVTWPATLPVSKFGLRVDPNNRKHVSPYTRDTQVIDFIGERWIAALSMPLNSFAVAQAVEAFFAQLRGMDGTVDLWHLARPVPTGTMRGSPVLSAGVAQGAQSLPVTTTAGATVKAGDMLGIGTGATAHLLMVAADATANGSGAITIPLVNRLRFAIASAAPVVWDRPKGRFRLSSDTAAGAVMYGKAIADAIQVEFTEF